MDIHCANQTVTDKKLHELALLYQFSNTLLSTIRLNKLTHLILTMLTSGHNPLFERAMLFLLNEKTGVLQGMLGVTNETSEGLIAVADEENPLGNRWDISEENIARQRASEFSSRIRMSRVELTADCPVIRTVIKQGRLFHTENQNITGFISFSVLKNLGLREFVAAPLIARDTPIGMLVVDNPISRQQVSVDELRFLKLVAGQAGMAIENSKLYKKLEEAHKDLQEVRERLMHGERLAAIGEMAASLVHELKNPLVTIGGFAGRLFKALPDASREQHYADTIVREAYRLEKMLADILAFSRKPTICYCHCQVAAILKESFESCATTLEDQAIRLIEPLELDKSWTVLGDAHQLKQVFLNLLLNAAESMPEGGLITVTVEEKADSDTGSLLISISDTGGGIPAALLPKIFHPFFTTKNHGTGLGLPIVNRIISNHKGSIEAGNEGSGAVFRVTLPLTESLSPEC